MKNNLFQHGGDTGEYWFRILGYGLAIKNINKGEHPYAIDWVGSLQIGKYLIKGLRG